MGRSCGLKAPLPEGATIEDACHRRSAAGRPAPVVEDNVFAANEAWEGGGARFCFFEGGLSEPPVRRNVFLDNEASETGGGIGVYSADPVITFCTFDQNRAGTLGGGIYAAQCEEAPILANSIVANSTAGGGIATANAIFFTAYCDVWGNAGGDYIGCSPAATDISSDPLYCEPDANDVTLRDDSPCLPENNAWGELMGAYGAGGCGQGIGDEAADLFRLNPPFPNPARGPVTLGYVLAAPAEVELTIISVDGRVVKRLAAPAGTRGEHSLVWDGTDASGRPVASGVYLVKGAAAGARSYRGIVLID